MKKRERKKLLSFFPFFSSQGLRLFVNTRQKLYYLNEISKFLSASQS